MPTVLPARYDAFLFIDRSHAVQPLFPSGVDMPSEDEPETYPSAM